MAKIRCTLCGEVLESKHRHDFQACKCGTFVDGGSDYMRLGFNVPTDIQIWHEATQDWIEMPVVDPKTPDVKEMDLVSTATSLASKPSKRYWKVLNSECKHGSVTYQPNVWATDDKPYNIRGEEGLYFTDSEHIFLFLQYGDGIAEVLDWKDGDGNKEFFQAPDDRSGKIKAHSLLLGEKRMFSKKLFNELVELGADIHKHSDLAIRWAAGNGDLRLVKLLLQWGANYRAQDNDAFVSACAEGHMNVVKYLMKLIKNTEFDISILSTDHLNGGYGLHRVSDAEYGSNDPKDYYIFGKLLSSVDGMCTYEHIMISDLSEEAKKDMMRKWSANIASRGFASACYNGQMKVMNYIFKEFGGYPTMFNDPLVPQRDLVSLYNGEALISACENNQLKVVQWIIKNIELTNEQKTDAITTVLYKNGDVNIIKYIIKSGVNIYAIKNYMIQNAIEKRNLSLLKFVLNTGTISKIDLNYAICWATDNGDANMINMFLKLGADIHTCHEYVLMKSCERGDLNLVTLAVKHGANIFYNELYAFRNSTGEVREYLETLVKYDLNGSMIIPVNAKTDGGNPLLAPMY